MDAQDIIIAIANGAADDNLDGIVEAVNLRRRYRRDERTLANKAAFTPGTRVRTRGLKPQYLNGLTGTVQAQPARRAKDLLDEGQDTGRYARLIGIPASALERAE